MQEIACLACPSMVALVITSEGAVHAWSEAGEVQAESEG
jgi:hypothetical protein